ncbi:hypothetical protein [[Clostridium] aminophilum]|uniref:Uncharacterized protein n=1 Tax=[Clostridium] aminophilum TaxID=1526 RepID=A0A1I6JMQ6_9FIRM|nr:hypothetical protein [[Clostridium] aminophilum]SFR80255.1 hypothetical protein SAMN02910262_01717 [[Clostridium] aminophilum]
MNKRLTAGITAAVYFTMSAVTPVFADIDPTGPVNVVNDSPTIDRSVNTDSSTGVSIQATDQLDKDMSVQVTGNVTVTNQQDEGTVTGVEVTNTSDANDVDRIGVTIGKSNEETPHSGGNITVSATGGNFNTNGVMLNNAGEGNVAVTTGNINVSSAGKTTSVGASVTTTTDYSDLYVDGGITATGVNGNTTGLEVNSRTDSEYNYPNAYVLVDGNVSSTSEGGMATGVDMTSVNSGHASGVQILGTVEATSTKGAATGLDLKTNNGGILATIANGVEAISTTDSAIGVDMNSVNGYIDTFVGEGGVYAEGLRAVGVNADIDDAGSLLLFRTGGGIYAFGDETSAGIQISPIDSPMDTSGSTLAMQIAGDVKSSGTGIMDLTTAEGFTSDIVIEGTLIADNGPAVSVMSDSKSSLNLTVWKIESGTDSLIAEKTSSGYAATEATEKLEKSIDYILKVDPDWTDSVSFTSANQKESKNGSVYSVGKEGEKVAVKLNIPEGYYVTSAYSDADQTVSLKRDTNGDYYLIVPKGGGVMISMSLALIPDTSDSNGGEGNGGDGNPPASGTTGATGTASADSIIASGTECSYTFGEGKSSVTFSAEEMKNILTAEYTDMTFRTSAGQFVITAADLNELLAKYGTLRFAIRNGRLAIFADNGYSPVMTLDPAGAAV